MEIYVLTETDFLENGEKNFYNMGVYSNFEDAKERMFELIEPSLELGYGESLKFDNMIEITDGERSIRMAIEKHKLL